MIRIVVTMIAVAWLTSACGPEKNTTADSEPTSGETSTSETSTMTGTATPTTGAQMCDAYLPGEDVGDDVSITITNTGATPLWLDAVGCAWAPALHIADDLGVEHFAGINPCPTPRCEALMQGDCLRGCNECGQPVAVRLDPGARSSLWWSGADAETMQMTAECAPRAECTGECVVGRARAPGTYEITVTAYTECTGTCECEAPEPGHGCALAGEVATSQPLVVTVPFEYPAVTEVEIPIGA